MATSARATFYYDFSSPYAYLAAERISGLFAEAEVEQPEWQPISFGHLLKATGRRPWSFEEDRSAHLDEIQRRASERGLPEVLYPEGWPVESYSLNPVRAAIYAKESGRVVSSPWASFPKGSRPAPALATWTTCWSRRPPASCTRRRC